MRGGRWVRVAVTALVGLAVALMTAWGAGAHGTTSGSAGRTRSSATTSYRSCASGSILVSKTKSEVEVYEQGSKVFGKIVGLTEPNDANGKPKVCTKCTGDDHDKPIVGLLIIKDLSRGGEHYKGGTIIEPEDGKIYKAEVWVEDGKLKVRGYLGVFYRTQTWVK